MHKIWTYGKILSLERQNKASARKHEVAQKDGDSSDWVLDSGATDHMSPYRAKFQNFKELKKSLEQLVNKN